MQLVLLMLADSAISRSRRADTRMTSVKGGDEFVQPFGDRPALESTPPLAATDATVPALLKAATTANMRAASANKKPFAVCAAP